MGKHKKHDKQHARSEGGAAATAKKAADKLLNRKTLAVAAPILGLGVALLAKRARGGKPAAQPRRGDTGTVEFGSAAETAQPQLPALAEDSNTAQALTIEGQAETTSITEPTKKPKRKSAAKTDGEPKASRPSRKKASSGGTDPDLITH